MFPFTPEKGMALSSPTRVGAFVGVIHTVLVPLRTSVDCSSKFGKPYGQKIVKPPDPDNCTRSSAMRGKSLATKASSVPPPWMVCRPFVDGQTGKSGDAVVPATYALPALSKAMAYPLSVPLPPRYVE